MFKKIKNLDPNVKLVAEVVLVRIVAPIAATAVAIVVANQIEKKLANND